MARWTSQTTPADIRKFSANSKVRQKLKARRKKIAAWSIAALLAAGLSARPAYRAFREHRINQNLQAANSAALQGDWSAARDSARSVLLARQDFQAYRIWTRALGKLGSPTTYMAVAELFTDSRATREDLLEALEVMALQAPQAVALSAYASLPLPFRDQAPFRAALVPLLIQRGQLKLAENCLREVAQPTDEPKVRLALLRVLCNQPDSSRVAEARQIFADLVAAKADTEALAALLLLGDVPDGLADGGPLPDLEAWLKNQPQATAMHHLLGLHPALSAHPESASRIYEMAAKRFLATDPGVLGTWLLHHDQAERVVKLLEEAAKTHSDAFIARLNALLRLKKDDDIAAALAAPPASADFVEIELVQANLAASKGDLIASGAAWTRALNHAAYDTTRNRCIDLARSAQRDGVKDAAEDAWVAAVRLGWGQLPPYADLLPVFTSLMAKGRSEDLMAMFRTLLRFEPRNPELLNNAYYFALLQGVLPPAQVVSVITKLIERQDTPVYNSTLMLAYLLNERPADALALLPKVQVGKGVAPMMIAALEGTARVLNGDTEAGSALLRDVNWREFMSQERMVFRSLLVKFENSKLPVPEMASPAVEINPDLIPAWRKALERFEKDRAGDVLPALLAPKIPGAEPPAPSVGAEPTPVAPWSNTKEPSQDEPALRNPPPQSVPKKPSADSGNLRTQCSTSIEPNLGASWIP